jgi:hypothetical protein
MVSADCSKTQIYKKTSKIKSKANILVSKQLKANFVLTIKLLQQKTSNQTY